MQQDQNRQRGSDNRPPQNRGPATDQRPAQGGPNQRPGNARQGNDRPQDRGYNGRGQQDRRTDDRHPEDRHPDNRGQDGRRPDGRQHNGRGYDQRDYGPATAGHHPEDGNGAALATRDNGPAARGLAPTTQGTVGSISPREQRNFIALVSTKSAAATRKECEPGLYHSRNLGSFQTITAEVVGCFYRQRYNEWDERSQVFRTYCEAAAPTIAELWGNGQPGGRCTECALTQWREVQVEGTNRMKNQPPLCGENVVFDLFIHEVAARAFWEVSSADNLDTIRNTINILNDRFGWGQYVIQLYSTMQMNSRNEPRYTPHIRHRADLQAFNATNIVDGSGQVVSGTSAELPAGHSASYNPSDGPPPYDYPDDEDHWEPAEEDDLPF